ncbi:MULTISPECIES: NADP-dependent oxidoreductase [unclassified Isoptericola]|uniref:NADP-dependent oxidoreductase n=1 Tax=unclassified Isoptericola TaxID=2623355 RepID=UPI002712D2D4|nr:MULTISPECIES: NADP-dependent oxidoreductase [unclassified Isoptericola]MDO8147818.1 NADP-dependent oxidoreductase [Isoptericola sp. b515]MDO8149923.1 NADP-dependent oxidoreductase [Isoptericola sp. b408]
MSQATSTQIQLAARPTGWPTAETFRTVEVTYGDLEPGQVRVANEYVSVDPYMRGRMNDVKSYVPPFALDETMTGGAVGRVVESASDDVPVGALVLHQYGWRDVVQEDAGGFQVLPEIPGVPSSLYLGILGMTGLTAYVGLTAIADLREGDTVFVSGAAGAVGTAVGQIARLLGAGRVIGSAGSAEKVELLTSRYGYDAAFNYKDAPVREQLREVTPDGVDVFFDNVGGDHLEAALDRMNTGGRIALCGAISQYNDTERTPGPDNLANAITRGLTLRGFTLGGYLDHAPRFRELMTGWFSEGKIAYDETVVDGIENAPQAFLDMMSGGNVGKMLVRTGA